MINVVIGYLGRMDLLKQTEPIIRKIREVLCFVFSIVNNISLLIFTYNNSRYIKKYFNEQTASCYFSENRISS